MVVENSLLTLFQSTFVNNLHYLTQREAPCFRVNCLSGGFGVKSVILGRWCSKAGVNNPDCTATNKLDTGEGLQSGWSGLWASDLREGCHRARPGQAQAAVAGACGPA